MDKKLLILRSAKIFFPKGPHIYKYLAENFGKLKEFESLDKQREKAKVREFSFLGETVETILKGEKIGKVGEASIFYIEEFLNLDLKNFLNKVKLKGYEIALFCSYPRTFFVEANFFLEFGINYIYGVANNTDEEMKIINIKLLEFKNEKFIKKEMAKLGFKGKFTKEPNCYGMLGKLIELMKEKNFTPKNTVLIGNSPVAQLYEKLAGKVITEFDDLNQVLKEL